MGVRVAGRVSGERGGGECGSRVWECGCLGECLGARGGWECGLLPQQMRIYIFVDGVLLSVLAAHCMHIMVTRAGTWGVGTLALTLTNQP